MWYEELFSFIYVYRYKTFVVLACITLLLYDIRCRGEKDRLYSRFTERRIKKLCAEYNVETKNRKGHATLEKYDWLKTPVIRNEIIFLALVQFWSGALMNVVVGDILDTGYNYFGFAVIAPWIFIAVCLLIKVDPFGHLDLFTPGYALSLMVLKLGCAVSGCCKGALLCDLFPSLTDLEVRFPSQLLESFVALLIFFFLMRYRKKAKPGTMQPMYLILYSATRFCTEFFRAKSNVFIGLKVYHFCCIAGVIIGVAELIIISRKSEQIRSIPERWARQDAERESEKN